MRKMGLLFSALTPRPPRLCVIFFFLGNGMDLAQRRRERRGSQRGGRLGYAQGEKARAFGGGRIARCRRDGSRKLLREYRRGRLRRIVSFCRSRILRGR